MAIEDTIYVLGKALDRERISLDVFLKVCYLPTVCRVTRKVNIAKFPAYTDVGERAIPATSVSEENY